MQTEVIERAKEHFARIVTDQLARVERMKQGQEPADFASLKPIIIGFCWGDGIGPIISRETQRVLEYLLKEEIEKGKVDFRVIEGLTIENRVKHLKAIPDDVLAELKACHVILKAPTTTPEKGGPYPNIESANVAMRRELDLFANVRPVKVPKDNIDWIFYRENTEGAYILGSKGIQVTPDLAIDFTATTLQGSERIIRMAFDYAARNNINKVTVVTKANVIKTTDGLFLETAERIAKEYPAVKWDAWYIDIMTAKLIDPKRRTQFRVVVLPNLYGDIITDEAAEFQGGVGTAGSANIGTRYAMFEAIHGSAPRMIDEGRGEYADPSSLIRAAAMMLRHIGISDKAEQLEMALDICSQFEKEVVITGREDGATGRAFCDYLLETVKDPYLKKRWQAQAR
ncbi:MAG TPA: isocitrate/isopropylmalate family dehydrogenase [bacterium]|nr:isocitrate/isopropylmalate family dehydrogenase [bacterium]HOH07917.1 isocitrate/isopropylmalate family dehydrogenase [bacterium]HOY45313.1 isocitrate/isopropylmalate family dehydrogenase [bacterium]HPG83820.1 isocitrate/isopropylmalate family dehydrogenase [bacterium]HPM60506.1 isocitrate/isopropylmalate family dehydrogenase [bacterium]